MQYNFFMDLKKSNFLEDRYASVCSVRTGEKTHYSQSEARLYRKIC